jgi:hypothetical protein
VSTTADVYNVTYVWLFGIDTVQEAREVCQHWWMKDALDRFVNRLTSPEEPAEEQAGHCSIS